MNFSETSVADALLIEPAAIRDDRGHFARIWCTEEFAREGLPAKMLQMNVGYSLKKGTLRGLHFQAYPHEECKVVRCTRGRVFDVVADLRANSSTYGRWFGVELTPENGLSLCVPEGCAHGYQTLKDDSEISYLTSAPFVASAARGIHYLDPKLRINWPLPVSIISAGDQAWPNLGDRVDDRAFAAT